ncbi:MAG: potassium transporter TrkA [Thermoanaerobaculia bacterium]
MSKPNLRERLAYAFDNSLARGPVVIIAYLALLSIALIVVLATVVWATGVAPDGEAGDKPGFIAIAWMALMRTLDSGTMGGDTGSWSFLLAMLAVTFGGIFVISTFIGTLTTAIEAKLDALRKGRSRVLESRHTVILGWSPRVFSIISELVAANENQKRAAVVVLGDRDKVEMEDEIRERVGDTKTTRVICRSGNPADMDDLAIVNLPESRSIILLPPVGPEADTQTIKALLAITNSPDRRPEPYHIVTEIRDPRNLPVATLAARGEAELVLVPDLLARVTVQTSRQAGLSVVYQELLDFGGDEIYFKAEPALAGKPFGEVLGLFEESSILGLQRADGAIQLNPPMDSLIGAGDRVIAISQDDDTIRLSRSGAATVDDSAIVFGESRPPQATHTLILGWNSMVPLLLRELENYVAAGSRARVVGTFPEGIETARAACPTTAKLRLDLFEGDPTDRATLDRLEIPSCDHVVLVSEFPDDDDRADGRTLVTLLHLREIREQSGNRFSIVSEMQDVRNRALAEITQADDFIIGDQLVSLLLTQVSENKALNAVFADLFDPEGAELYLKPVKNYVRLDREVSFATLVEAARRRGEIAIGFRQPPLPGAGGSGGHGVVTNPPKSRTARFGERDSVIVLAEN